MKPEQILERDLADAARYFGCLYIKIPDTHMINAKNRMRNREDKRPFDGILLTPTQNWCIECKIDYAPLKPHQDLTRKLINDFNQTYIIIRKIRRKSGTIYQCQHMEFKLEFKKIEGLLNWIKDIR